MSSKKNEAVAADTPAVEPEPMPAPKPAAKAERLVWRVAKGRVVPEGGRALPALYSGQEMGEDDPRFAAWRGSLVSSWE